MTYPPGPSIHNKPLEMLVRWGSVTLLALLLAACSPSPPDRAPEAVVPPAESVAGGTEPASSTASASPQTDRERLNGVWKLVHFEQDEPGGGTSLPYTDQAVGRLTFDHAGRMSVFVAKPGRQASVNTTAGVALASMDDLRQIADGFLAYYGTFTVDEETRTITANLEAATLPAWTNSQQKRTYELDGKQLTLLTPATKLVWERLPD